MNQSDLSGSLEFVRIVPAGALAGRVRCIWALRSPAAPAPDFEPILPDGCAELVLNLAEPFERLARGARERQPSALFVGQMLGPVAVRPTGITDLVGVRFEPWGAYGLVDVALADLTDRIATPEAFRVSLPGDVAARLESLPALSQRVRLMERLLQQALPPPVAPPPVLRALAGGTERRVSRAASLAGMGCRQLERLSLRWVGLPPRELVQLVRFQQALRRVQFQPSLPLVRVAILSGYADQAHLTREFRRLAGTTPGRYRTASAALTRSFVESDAGPAGPSG